MKKDKENKRKRRHNSNEDCEDAGENERSTGSKPSTSSKRSKVEEHESFIDEVEDSNRNGSKVQNARVIEKAKTKQEDNPKPPDGVDRGTTKITGSGQPDQLNEKESITSAQKAKDTSSSTTNHEKQLQNLDSQDGQEAQGDDQPQRKRKRRVRVKKVREDLKQQMEFYFCDANLRKDRYMTELVSNNEGGWVEIIEFLKFNKIKTLLEEKGLEIGEVAKAVRGSELVEVSDDSKKIRRNLDKHPVKQKSQQMIDDCTVYVQGLQPIASVEWLRGNFAEFGHVEYVSLPRGPNGRHKGFGFIEFAEVAGAENACKFYSLEGGRVNGPGGSCLDSGGGGWIHGGSGAFGSNAKSINTNSSAINGHSQQLAQRANLQVISKKEWLGYKNKYLKLRKQSANTAKKYLSAVAEGHSRSPAGNHGDSQHEQTGKGQRQNSRVDKLSGDHGSDPVTKRARQMYGEERQSKENPEDQPNGGPQPAEEADKAKTAEEKDPLEGGEMKRFERGCIIKIEASKGLLRTDKALMRSIPGVAFVDMIENDPIAFVRFNNPEEAAVFATSHSASIAKQQNVENDERVDQADGSVNQAKDDVLRKLGVKHCSVLQNEEETNYWQRVELMRGRKKQSNSTAKRDKNSPKMGQTDAQGKGNRRSRGRQRLKEKYEKYTNEADKQIEVRMNKRIVFDD